MSADVGAVWLRLRLFILSRPKIWWQQAYTESKMKNRKRKYKPYQQVKMKFFQMPDLFGDAPIEVRQKALRDIGAKARAAFELEYPKLLKWFETYDPLYVLSFCSFYFLTSQAGIDKEAIDGEFDFGHHHLELLQALALMRSRKGTPQPLSTEAEALQKSLRDLTQTLLFAQFDFPAEMSDAELKKRSVLAEMRAQTLTIRNWAYPEQTVKHLKSMFEGPLSGIIASQYQGLSIVQMIDALTALGERVNERLNNHIRKLRPVATAKDFETTYHAYRQAFPDVLDDREGMFEVFDRLCGRDLRQLQIMLLMPSDLRFEYIFTFSLDDIARAYGNDEHRRGLAHLMQKWSYKFGDLADWDPKHFIYTNPILQRPFIRLGEDSFYWVQCGIYSHMLPGMLEDLIPGMHRDDYMATRTRYLEDQV